MASNSLAESVERLLDPVFDRPDSLAPLDAHQQLLERLAKRMRWRSTLGFELGHLLRVAIVVVAHLFLSTRALRPTFSASIRDRRARPLRIPSTWPGKSRSPTSRASGKSTGHVTGCPFGSTDQVGCLLGHHHGWQVGVPARDPGHDGCIDDAQCVETAHAELSI